MVGPICPRCQSFDVREMTVQVVELTATPMSATTVCACSTTSTSAPTIPCQ